MINKLFLVKWSVGEGLRWHLSHLALESRPRGPQSSQVFCHPREKTSFTEAGGNPAEGVSVEKPGDLVADIDWVQLQCFRQ